MKGYMIPYIDPKKLKGYEDPLFSEFTYGDVERSTICSSVTYGLWLGFNFSKVKI